MRVTAQFIKSGDMYAAHIVEIPGVNTQGNTLNEAKENLKDALDLFLDYARTEAHAQAIAEDNIIEEVLEVA